MVNSRIWRWCHHHRHHRYPGIEDHWWERVSCGCRDKRENINREGGIKERARESGRGGVQEEGRKMEERQNKRRR